jgi:hypothetical protein
MAAAAAARPAPPPHSWIKPQQLSTGNVLSCAIITVMFILSEYFLFFLSLD